MKVSIEEFGTSTLEIRNKGIKLAVAKPGGKHKGNLVVTGTKLIWYPGKTQPPNGHVVKWDDFIEEMKKRPKAA